MRSIVFYNHYHNGDILCSKSFIQDIMNTIPTEYFYSHRMNPKVLEDMSINSVSLNPSLPNRECILLNDEMIFVNTWIGSYFDRDLKCINSCTLKFAYEMYGRIFQSLSSLFDVKLELKSIEEYFPLIDYSRLKLNHVNDWLKTNNKRKILISNGPCHSGQCSYNGDMSDMINGFAERNKNVTFLTTHKIASNHENVVYTSDVTKANDFDLNEISYLSTHCDTIIGRCSGPFIFSLTKENMINSNKTLFCFGDRETDYLLQDIPTISKSIFHKYENIDTLNKAISSIL